MSTTYPVPPVPAGVDALAWMAAVAAVRRYCKWHIAPSVTETVTVDGSAGYVQLLPTLHLTELTSITNDGVLVDSPEWSEMGAVRGALWTQKFRGVVAEIVHGYDDFPPEVLAVMRSMAAAGSGSVASRLASGPHSADLTEQAQAGAGAMANLHFQVLNRYRIESPT